jgi:PAS domain S-box-containing protein
VYFKDRLSRFLLVSAGWIAAYAPGRDAGELIGKTDFDIFGDPRASAAFEDEQRIIRTGQPIVEEVERQTRSGRPDAWVSTTKMPLRDGGGQIIGTFGISRDVTALVEAQNALTRQAQQLSPSSERMRELDGLKDDFLGLVSHELRTRPEAQRKHMDLAFCTAAIPRLAVDPARMAQLLGNLISNAVKFTPDGGKVEVSLRMDEDQAVLSVADTGVGIPAADRERIFERFFRTATATRQVIPGTGLGLAIAKDIVEAHHGTIAVDSDEGRGSTFLIRIPRQAPPGTVMTSEST